MARGHGTFATVFRSLPDLWRLDRTALLGHARMLCHPAYKRLITTEPLVRFLVPLLIVLFVLMLGYTRISSFVDQRAMSIEDAKTEIGLIAKAVSINLDGMDIGDPGASPPDALHGILANALPASTLKDGRMVILADADNRISAVLPDAPDLQGLYLDDYFGPGQPMTTLGERAGVLRHTVSSGAVAYATLHHLADGSASVSVIQPVSAVFAHWRAMVSQEATVFVATAIVLVFLGFAYHAQVTRAAESDFIYRKTQERFQHALMHGRSGLWDWDLSRGAIFWSPSMFGILGLEAENKLMSVGEVAGLIHPGDTNLVDLADSLLRSENAQVDREFRMRHADGHDVWVRARGEVIRDSTDHPHLVGIAVDISEQKRLAEASRTADLRLRDAVEAISEAFVLWDSSNRLVLCNSKYQDLYGLPDNLVRTGTGYDLIAVSSRRPMIVNALEDFDGGEVGARSVEARVDGRWLQINERRTKDGGFVSVGTDISTLKLNESQLLENERVLTATVSDLRRSRQQLELQAQQLVELAEKYAEEKEKAEDSHRIKSEFMANVSHELRTPLNAIIGFSDMMLSDSYGPLGDDKYIEYCRDIKESGRYLFGIISDILEMSRLEDGTLELIPDTLDLQDLVGETIRAFADETKAANIRVREDYGDDIGLIADRSALRQILFNILSNAIKFSEDNGMISIAVTHRDGMIHIKIADNGIGIEREALAKLGRPFEQVQSQFTRDHKGSGLGLAISRSLAVLHGGDLLIRSRRGVGTTVTAILPKSHSADDELQSLSA